MKILTNNSAWFSIPLQKYRFEILLLGYPVYYKDMDTITVSNKWFVMP